MLTCAWRSWGPNGPHAAGGGGEGGQQQRRKGRRGRRAMQPDNFARHGSAFTEAWDGPWHGGPCSLVPLVPPSLYPLMTYAHPGRPPSQQPAQRHAGWRGAGAQVLSLPWLSLPWLLRLSPVCTALAAKALPCLLEAAAALLPPCCSAPAACPAPPSWPAPLWSAAWSPCVGSHEQVYLLGLCTCRSQVRTEAGEAAEDVRKHLDTLLDDLHR